MTSKPAANTSSSAGCNGQAEVAGDNANPPTPATKTSPLRRKTRQKQGTDQILAGHLGSFT
jgi:hypothetical protein